MNSPYDGDPPLTDEQQAILDLPWDDLTLVTAGPGAGKTHTLVRRIEHLIERDDLGAGELLVLTFSRAAVRELKDRLVNREAAGRYVRVQTFDAWALELLLTVDAQTDWRSRSFDDRIAAATGFIGSPVVNEWLDDLGHVFVDEVQDLVGSRREMVSALLATYECGFTVVGDPAQAVYGFQVTDPAARATETNRFPRWLRAEFGSDLVELPLTRNFRADSDDARAALHLGQVLQESAESTQPEDGKVLFERTRRQLNDLDNFGSPNDPNVGNLLNIDYRGTTAVLCHTNGQALLVSEALHRHGVEHGIRRGATHQLAPAWLAPLFRSGHESMVPWSSFQDILHSAGVEENAQKLWRRLTSSSRGRNSALELHQLRTLIAGERLPDEVTGELGAKLTVSSIHRAKGLEFDRVLLTDPGALQTRRDDPVELAESARMLYVGLTRPRRDLWRLEAPDIKPLCIRHRNAIDRWTRGHIAKQWKKLGLEMKPRDAMTEQPAGNDPGLTKASAFTASASAVQDYLADKVRPGDPLVLLRRPDNGGTPQDTEYLITHGPQRFPIGVTSESFSWSMRGYLGRSDAGEERKWPAMINNVRVDGVETVAGSQAAGESAGLGSHGIWLAPRMVGLSRFQYSDSNSGK